MGAANVKTRGPGCRGFSQADLLASTVCLLLLAAILSPSLTQARARSQEATCDANLRAIGQAMHIYANDNAEWFPIHFFRGRNAPPTDPPFEDSVHWVGTMGSNDFLRISEQTSSTHSPDRNHPSRSLFLLIIDGLLTPGHFVCPSSGDTVDDLWNYGPDAGGPGQRELGEPGVNRFDFRGYENLSYGYQLPYGRRAKPRETLDPQMPISADKGPYYRASRWRVAGTRTVHERRSRVDPPREWLDLSLDEILAMTTEWEPYNSRNHDGDGQNVLLVDGSVTFAPTPIVGIDYDNIYAFQNSTTDPHEIMIGVVPDAEQAWGPLTNTDSVLVP
jgi:type II secretory pathway pseudopilin PulG